MLSKEVFLAAATLVGMTVGAGILGIPYVVAQAGYWTGIVVLVLIGLVTLYINLCIGEIVLRTKGDHQLTGYADKYLGRRGKYWLLVLLMMSNYGALCAYVLGASAPLGVLVGGTSFRLSLGFLIVLSLVIYGGVRFYEDVEGMLTLGLLILIVGIIVLGFGHMNTGNLSGFDVGKLYIPFGVILFAFNGMVAVPQMKEELTDNRLLRPAVIVAMVSVSLVYLFFMTVTLGLTGSGASAVATTALGQTLGGWMNYFANAFSLLCLSTSFLGIGYCLKEIYSLDFGFPKFVSWMVVLIVPLFVLFFNLGSFITILNYTGSLVTSLVVITILVMYHKARLCGEKKPEYVLPYNRVFAVFVACLFITAMLLVLL